MKTILVTGAAGFIGWKTSQLLCAQKCRVIGVDNLNDYYDVRLKQFRLKDLKIRKNFQFHKLDIENYTSLERLFKKYSFSAVINLAARAGVRYSLKNPHIYFSTNTLGTVNLLEICKQYDVRKFVLASTSSLYAGQKMPFKESLPVNTPISPYAASKKAAESACYAYHFLYGIDISILRYFTVYGPAGRPDMSIFRFIKWADEQVPLEIFGDGTQSRDFTYIDDIAAGTIRALKKVGFQVINLGSNQPYELNYAIELIEKNLNKKRKLKRFPFHKADLKETWADISKAKRILGWRPTVRLAEGVEKTVAWYIKNKKWLSAIEL